MSNQLVSKLQLALTKCDQPLEKPEPANNSFLEDLQRIKALKPQPEPTNENEAPESPDPQVGRHRSKLVKGIAPEVKQSSDDLRAEQQRLREYFKNNRAESSLFESKFGEIRKPDYNDWL